MKQGDPLSLFFWSVHDRLSIPSQRCTTGGAGMLGGLLLQSLLYADDLVLMAESADQLQYCSTVYRSSQRQTL